MKCLWCGEQLTFKSGKGWLHPDGELIKTFVGADGKERDDHCAYHIPDDAPTFEEEGRRLAQEIRDEEIALGTSPRDAAIIANSALGSSEYRAAWVAERAERREEREEEDYCPCLTGCPECGGVPNHYWSKEEGT